MSLHQHLYDIFIDILPFLQLISALAGGVIAVLIGQILSFYRDEISVARSFRYNIEYLSELLDEDIQIEAEPDRLDSTLKELQSLYVSNRWLLGHEGQQQFRELSTKVRELIQDEQTRAGILNDKDKELQTERVLELCKQMDNKTAHVTKLDAYRRFRGKERPYDNHGKISK